MGHTRLGELSRTRKWTDVVALLAAGAGISQLANATISAAERGLNLASGDHAIVETVYLLSQLPLAARSGDFAGSLRNAGLNVPDAPGLMDVVAAVSEAVDARVGIGRRSDLGEMAQMAAAETIAGVVGRQTQSLFGTTSTLVQQQFASLGTEANFGAFTREFFGRLADRTLQYFLSRAYSYHTGEGQRFATLADHGRFSEALGVHCREAARIVQDFGGQWFSKTNWQQSGEITREHAKGFAHVAMQKLVAELKAGARPAASSRLGGEMRSAGGAATHA